MSRGSRPLFILTLTLGGLLGTACFAGRDLEYVDERSDVTPTTAAAAAPSTGPDVPRTEPARDPASVPDPTRPTSPDPTRPTQPPDPTPVPSQPPPDPAPQPPPPVQPPPAQPPALNCPGGVIEIEPNNAPEAARELAAGKTCGQLEAADVDFFTTDPDGFLRLRFEATGDARIRLQNGLLVLEKGPGGTFRIPTQGRWSVKVWSPANAPQTYSLERL